MVKRLIEKIFDVRKGEGLRVSLMFAYIFLIIAALITLKPVSKSLLLSRFGIAQLPVVFTLVSVFSGIFSIVYIRWIRNVRPNLFVQRTLVGSIISLLVFWVLLRQDYYATWFVYFFYIWVAIFGVITSSQFWFLANYVFDAREAKRLFGVIGAGAISGGIFGGYSTNLLAPWLGSENLILVCFIFVVLCIPIIRTVWSKSARFGYRERMRQQKRVVQSEATHNPFQLVVGSRLLLYLAGIVGISVLVANLVDYQYSAIAMEMIPDEDKLTAFFGFWLSTLSIVSLLVQLILTNQVLRSFGVGASLFFLPIGILTGALAIVISPALWSAVLIKVNDGSLKQSIQKAGIELLHLPIPAQIKTQSKQFIDVFVDNLATGLAGVVLIVFTVFLDVPVFAISLLTIVLIGMWLYLNTRIKAEYVNSFRMAIKHRTIDLEDQTLNLDDASVLETITNVLKGNSEKQILYVLNLIENVKSDRLAPILKGLIQHPSSDIKVKVFQIMNRYDKEDLVFEASDLIEDPDQRVRVEALSHLCTHSIDKAMTLNRFLNHEKYEVRGAALLCAARVVKSDSAFGESIAFHKLVDDTFQDYINGDHAPGEARFVKLNLANVIGTANDEGLLANLEALFNDTDSDVVRAAIMNAGKTHSDIFFPYLINHLKVREYRVYARQALANYGEEVIDSLVPILEDPEGILEVKQEIIKVLALIGSQKSVDVLDERIAKSKFHLRSEPIRSLNRLKNKFPLLHFDQKSIRKKIFAELDYQSGIGCLIPLLHESDQGLSGDGSECINARRLVIQVLQERLEASLERVFRLLGLIYSSRDIYNAYLGIVGRSPLSRANAIEYLDNVLASDLKKYIIPIVETMDTKPAERPQSWKTTGDIQSMEKVYDHLLKEGDGWLQSCAIYLLGTVRDKAYLGRIRDLLESSDLRVREAAGQALKKLEAV